MRVQSLNHSTYELQYHIVWSTRYRCKWLKDYVQVELWKSLRSTVKKYPTLHIIEMNTDQEETMMFERFLRRNDTIVEG